MVFMLVIIAFYILGFFINKYIIIEALINTGIILIKIIPILILVFIIQFFGNIYFKSDKVQKHLSDESGIISWAYAVMLGFLISGPPYALFPLLGDMQRRGMSNSLIAVILYNRNIKIPFLPVMVYYFGLVFTVIISVYILLFSIINGLLIGRFANKINK